MVGTPTHRNGKSIHTIYDTADICKNTGEIVFMHFYSVFFRVKD